jgi:glycosyltransferase involved in cell wall biosynthesis
MTSDRQPGPKRSAATEAASAFLRRHETLLRLWRALYRPVLLWSLALDALRLAARERKKLAAREREEWSRFPQESRKFIRRETARRARHVSSKIANPARRMVFLNDLGFLYGAGIAQKRQAASFLLSGWSVSIFASQAVPIPRYAYFTGNPKIDRGLSVAPPVSAATVVGAVMDRCPQLVIVGNIHGAAWPVRILSGLQDRGATVVAYMHDCYWVTGRCVHPRSCTRYITGCNASCPTPNEHPRLAPDEIHAAWRERETCFSGPRAIPIVANSHWTAQLARNRFPSSRIDVIHLGLDHNLFAPIQKEAARRMMNMPLDKPIIVLGSLNVDDDFKGGRLFRDLCKMLAARSDIRVAVIGKGSHSIDGILPLGLVDDERLMPLILNCADIYVNTAVEESFGQMLLEASACGIPTIAIAAGGVSDIVTDETGILVREKRACALTTAIDTLLSDAALRDRMGHAARARVLERFTLIHQARAWNRYLLHH